MTQAVAKRLEALKYHTTRYELVLSRGEQQYLVRYTRKSGTGLRNEIRGAWDKLAEITGAEEWRLVNKGYETPTGWRIAFSGRTQRDAILEGALPFIFA